MPDGVMLWFDPNTGDARIGRGGKQYPARKPDMEPGARRAGARVHFDIDRDRGVERATAVEIREGTHTSRHHHRMGTLVGAHRPDTKGVSPVDLPPVEHGLSLAGHPLAVAGAWGRWLAIGDVEHALKLYAPDAQLHHDGVTIAGLTPLHGFLDEYPITRSGRVPTVHGEGDLVRVRWDPVDPERGAVEALCRVEHGQIAEQWTEAARPAPTATLETTPTGVLLVDAVTHGDVNAEAVTYARQRILALTNHIEDPVLYARIKLTHAADPARSRPELAQALLDVNGRLVRAHVAAHDMHEAIDLLQQRLRDKLQHLAQRQKAERHLHEIAEPGEWRHGDLPTVRPEYFDRPEDERRLVRHKAFFGEELTEEEAAFDMDQLDYDFHLYRDLASGEDSILERRPDGHHVARLLDSAPVLTVEEAIRRLRDGGERFVFFDDATTRRGAVVYHRYDGNEGLVTLE